MNDEIRDLQPKALWNNFADLNAVPRASKKEDRVIEFIKNFGENLGLDTQVDETGNVVIRKPATTGLEDRKTIVLQSHLDMVHQKNNDTKFDFDTQGIKMYVDGDWVKAEGTTLGADNGLGVATIMAILQSDDIQHPAIEALFTIDEETGMTGAKGLSPELLDGDILLNLDTEEDDEIGIGCAGGIDITALREYEEENIPELVRRTRAVFNDLKKVGTIKSHELIFVNDASTDRSRELLVELDAGHNDIRIINMSRNFGVFPCTFAGGRVTQN